MGDVTFMRYIKEFANPVDTAIGSSFGSFDLTDTTKMLYAYDRDASIRILDNDKILTILKLVLPKCSTGFI